MIDRFIGLGIAVTLLSGCALQPLQERKQSIAIKQNQAQNTPLGQALQPLVDAHPGLSGIYALPDAHDAFAVRGFCWMITALARN